MLLCPNCNGILQTILIPAYGGFNVDYFCSYCNYSTLQERTTFSNRTEYANNITTTGDKTYEVYRRKE